MASCITKTSVIVFCAVTVIFIAGILFFETRDEKDPSKIVAGDHTNRPAAHEAKSFSLSEMNSRDPNHYYYFTDSIYRLGVPDESHVSDIDCFHPSGIGQERLSAETWSVLVDEISHP
jgi:hypothetical protein